MNDDANDLTVLVDISDQEFAALARLIYQQFGIHLTDKKKALVRGRLNKVLKLRQLSSFREYLELVQKDDTGTALVELIDRISTNHTFFFREAEHFQFLQDQALDELATDGAFPDEIRVWCAGCATGEEAYTLAMLTREWAKKVNYPGRLKILATDISVTALETAVAGVYNDERVRLVPQQLKQRYFEHIGPDQWRVSDDLRRMILFKRLNFMDPRYPFRNAFHVVFCRNVMIYFDRETKDAVVKKVTSCLEPGRYFFVGHSETLGREDRGLQYVRPSVYRRNPA